MILQAAVFNGKKIELTDVSRQELGNNEVLLNVAACGICGTDIKIVAGQSAASPPVILGHEYCGTIEKVGKKVKDLSVGDFVSVDPNIYCGKCRFCRMGKINLCENLLALGVNIDGGFAEYCVVPERQCYKLPKIINPVQAAMMEPLSCAVYGYQKAGIRTGEMIVIVGGGMIGLLILKLCLLSSAGQIIIMEPNKTRQSILKSAGADYVFSPEDESFSDELMDICHGGADVVIECVGDVAAVDQSFRLLKRGGRLVIFGVSPSDQDWTVSPYNIFRNDITITGSFLNPYTFQTAVELTEARKITLDDIDVKTFPLDRIMEAFDYQTQGKSMKTIIELSK